MIKTKKKSESTLQKFTMKMRPVPPGSKRRGPRPLRGSEDLIPPLLVRIVTTGLSRIQRNPQRCAVEAEHLSSLPALLLDFDPEILDRYWNTERVAFMKSTSPSDLVEFEPLWQELAEVLRICKEEHERGEF